MRLASLDLYREQDPFRRPRLREIESPADLLELASTWTGGFPEPMTFSIRLRSELARRAGHFDIVHDNQSLGGAIAGLISDGWPVVASIHHPVDIDRAIDLDAAESLTKRLGVRRWYGFSKMQGRVARELSALITVSQSSKSDIVSQLRVPPGQVVVVPAGVDAQLYRPLPSIERVPGRIMTTASADVALKGLSVLLEALAKLRTERAEAHLVVIGSRRHNSHVDKMLMEPELAGAVRFITGASDEEVVANYAAASVAVVPSLYEGFSLPAVEAMASGVPLVATTGGALPEVVGRDGTSALLVEPGDPSALATALKEILDDPDLAARLGAAGRERVLERFTWIRTAEATVDVYRSVIESHRDLRLKDAKAPLMTRSRPLRAVLDVAKSLTC